MRTGRRAQAAFGSLPFLRGVEVLEGLRIGKGYRLSAVLTIPLSHPVVTGFQEGIQ